MNKQFVSFVLVSVKKKEGGFCRLSASFIAVHYSL
jgi:hypothetical protein